MAGATIFLAGQRSSALRTGMRMIEPAYFRLLEKLDVAAVSQSRALYSGSLAAERAKFATLATWMRRPVTEPTRFSRSPQQDPGRWSAHAHLAPRY
jgi:hypothetical protein